MAATNKGLLYFLPRFDWRSQRNCKTNVAAVDGGLNESGEQKRRAIQFTTVDIDYYVAPEGRHSLLRKNHTMRAILFP